MAQFLLRVTINSIRPTIYCASRVSNKTFKGQWHVSCHNDTTFLIKASLTTEVAEFLLGRSIVNRQKHYPCCEHSRTDSVNT